MTSTLNVRVDKKIKKLAQAVAEGMGMDLSTCVRMLLTQMAQRGSLPLPRLTANGFTEAEEEAILKAAEDDEGSETMTLEEFQKSLEVYHPKTKAVQKDERRAHARGLDMRKLHEAVTKLATGTLLDAHYKDHRLQGTLSAYRECHLDADWLLVYRIHKTVLILELVRTGSHSDIF